MKKTWGLFIAAVLMSLLAYTAQQGAPYQPEVDSRFNTVEELVSEANNDEDGIKTLHLARATLDCGSGCAVGGHSLDVSLPAKSLIKHVYGLAVTQGVSVSGGTVALFCEDANNLISARNMTSYASGSAFFGAPLGTSGTVVGNIAAECEITAQVASSDYSAGKFNFFVEYLQHD